MSDSIIDRFNKQRAQIDEDRKLAELSTDAVIEAIQEILSHAYGDTGGSKRCAAFILSLWDGGKYKCDLQDLLYTDSSVHHQFLMVMDFLHKTNNQLYTYVDESQVKPIIEAWGDVFLVEQ